MVHQVKNIPIEIKIGELLELTSTVPLRRIESSKRKQGKFYFTE